MEEILLTIQGWLDVFMGLPFFDGIDWQVLVAFLFFMLFGVTAPGFNFFNFLKEKLGVADAAANSMVMAASVAITLIAMAVTGQLDIAGLDLTFGNVVSFAGTLYAASQYAYQRFKEATPDPDYSDIGDFPG